MRNLRHAWYIALNDVRGFMTDRLAFGMFILFPFLFIIMFTLVLGNVGSTSDKRLEFHVATQETTGISLSIIQSIVTGDISKLAPGQPDIIWEKDYAQAMAQVDSGKLDGFLAFPADFTPNVMAGKNTYLEVVSQANAVDKRMALDGLARSVSSAIAADTVEIKAVAQLLAQQGRSQTEIQQAMSSIIQSGIAGGATAQIIAFQPQSVGSVKTVNASSYVVPGYLVMFVFFAAAMASVSIIRERQNHTLERLLASSVKKESIIGGFFLGGIFRGLVQIVIFWTMGLLVFHVDVGASPGAVIGLSLLVVLMSAGFAIFMATVAKTERSASALGVLCSLVLAPLGGSWWPLFIDPKWMQFLAKFTPHGWANDGFNKLMLFGATGGDALMNMLALLGFTLVFVVLAVMRFKTSAA